MLYSQNHESFYGSVVHRGDRPAMKKGLKGVSKTKFKSFQIDWRVDLSKIKSIIRFMGTNLSQVLHFWRMKGKMVSSHSLFLTLFRVSVLRKGGASQPYFSERKRVTFIRKRQLWDCCSKILYKKGEHWLSPENFLKSKFKVLNKKAKKFRNQFPKYFLKTH